MWLRSCCLLLFVLSECLTTKITLLDVPSEVELDSSDSDELTLDCQYELESDDGLVVSWYFNDEKIYQWIKGSMPSAKNSFKDHLRLDYNVSDIPNQTYRALRLLNPVGSLSGEYQCTVSTHLSEDKQKKYLQFYDAGEGLNLTSSLQPGNDTDGGDELLVQCAAAGVFPQAHLTIYIDGEEVNQTRVAEEDEEEEFNCSTTATVPAATLAAGDEIRCELALPRTSYNYSEVVVYTGGSVGGDDEGSGEAVEDSTAAAVDSEGGASMASSASGHLLLAALVVVTQQVRLLWST